MWHLLNFFAPALGVACIAAALAKLLWRSALRTVAWTRLALWATVACAAVLVGGLLLFGHDGKIATYAAMVVACGVALWAAGFGWRRA